MKCWNGSWLWRSLKSSSNIYSNRSTTDVKEWIWAWLYIKGLVLLFKIWNFSFCALGRFYIQLIKWIWKIFFDLYKALPDFILLLISLWIYHWYFTVSPKHSWFYTFIKDDLSTSIAWSLALHSSGETLTHSKVK